MYDRICGFLRPNGIPCTNPSPRGYCEYHRNTRVKCYCGKEFGRLVDLVIHQARRHGSGN